MNFEDLTPEQRAKALECKTAEELVDLAERFGVALTEEQLAAVSGGDDWGITDCSTNTCEKDFVW